MKETFLVRSAAWRNKLNLTNIVYQVKYNENND